jgi:SAM-dependent methyltransferase
MDWETQQLQSIERYQDNSYEADGTIGELFGGFIAVTLDRTKLVLDIGCGLHPLLPHYVKELSLPNFCGIEPLEVDVDRGFRCLTGVQAENIPLETGSAGAAIFATSLDHIEDANAAIKEVTRVVDGPLYFWLGVHDPEFLAESKTFGVVMNHRKGLRKLLSFVLAPLEYCYVHWQMHKRRRDLANGTPLDSAHVRYHTMAKVDKEFAGYGLKITRRVVVPGSASAFVEATPV